MTLRLPGADTPDNEVRRKNRTQLRRAVLLITVAGACAPADSGPDDAPLLNYTIDAQAGHDLADEKTFFAVIGGVAASPHGLVFVADPRSPAVKAFNSSGAYLYDVARAGSGPGELGNPCCLAFDSAGRLWLRDGENARYSAYAVSDSAATFLKQLRSAHGGGNYFAPITFEADGRLIDIGSRSTPTGSEIHRVSLSSDSGATRDVTIPSVRADSLAMKRANVNTGGAVITFFLYQPFGPVQLVAHAPRGDWVHGLSSHYAFDWRAVDGTLVRRITGNVEHGPELSAAERKRAEQSLEQDRKRIGKDPGFTIPVRKTPVRRLYFDARGRLWVELNTPDGSARRADIYDDQGRFTAQAEWPAQVDLSHGAVRGDTLWGVATDSLGVQSLVRLVGRTN